MMAYTTTAAQFCETKLPALLASEAFADLDAIVELDLEGNGGGEWIVDCASKTVSAKSNAHRQPTMIVRATAADFMAVAEGRMSASDGMLTERLHVAGDIVHVGQVLALLERSA
jgi:putative sterol carrier protein